MNVVEKILLERVKKNKEIFSKDEINFIKNNIEIVKKIYVLGVFDAN